MSEGSPITPDSEFGVSSGVAKRIRNKRRLEALGITLVTGGVIGAMVITPVSLAIASLAVSAIGVAMIFRA